MTMVVAGTTGKISSIFLGGRRVSTIFLGEQMLFPMSEMSLGERIDECINADDVPQVEFDEPPDQIEMNMLRQGNNLERPHDVPTTSFTPEQQEKMDRIAELLGL